MKKPKIMVIGEGITEYYYIRSLSSTIPGLALKPDYPKHSSIHELGKKIRQEQGKGYACIYCLVDMDTKPAGSTELTQYQSLKREFAGNQRIVFIENHLCSELFFLYYFTYSTRPYANQDQLLNHLRNHCGEYEKTEDFFRTHPLHNHFLKSGGTLENAVINSERSMAEIQAGERDYTYTDMVRFIKALN